MKKHLVSMCLMGSLISLNPLAMAAPELELYPAGIQGYHLFVVVPTWEAREVVDGTTIRRSDGSLTIVSPVLPLEWLGTRNVSRPAVLRFSARELQSLVLVNCSSPAQDCTATMKFQDARAAESGFTGTIEIIISYSAYSPPWSTWITARATYVTPTGTLTSSLLETYALREVGFIDGIPYPYMPSGYARPLQRTDAAYPHSLVTTPSYWWGVPYTSGIVPTLQDMFQGLVLLHGR